MSESTTGTTARKRTTKNTKEPKMAKKTFSVTKTKEPITFQVDDDEFEAVPADALPAGALAQYFEDINKGDLFKAHDGFFKTVLTEDSYKIFNERLNSKDKPITVAVLGEIATWLLGDEYMGGNPSGDAKS